MTDKADALLLDCTLRDGGYVNNWSFDTLTAVAVIDGLYNAGARWIEIGIMGKAPKPGLQTKFSDFGQIKPLLVNRKSDCHYAVMVTTALSDNFEYPPCGGDTPDVIRIAYFKPELEKTLSLARKLKELGYSVFLQAMATFMYSDDELGEMLKAVNALKPSAFYMVDSFSTMYPADVRAMRDRVLGQLSPDISFGFHAHNNIQMAFANVQEFLNCDERSRPLFVDSSVFGMGRGAGNVPTELLMEYLNRGGAQYELSHVLAVYQKYLEPIYRQYGWGYTLPYFLTAIRKTNSAYGWYYMNHGLVGLEELDSALKKIPEDVRYTLKSDIADRILKEVQNIE